MVAMVTADEWESLQETLAWLSQPGTLEGIAEAEADVDAGRTYDETQIRPDPWPAARLAAPTCPR